MLVVDLHCEHAHVFEGWFASADDLASQQARGLVSCPVCGSVNVVRRPSASRLNVSGLKDESGSRRQDVDIDRRAQVPVAAPVARADQVSPEPVSGEAAEMLEAVQAVYLQAVRHVLAQTEDVGARFADEARSIHHGDAPVRPIRGQTTPEEREALQDEGIEVLSLPVPDALKGPVQ